MRCMNLAQSVAPTVVANTSWKVPGVLEYPSKRRMAPNRLTCAQGKAGGLVGPDSLCRARASLRAARYRQSRPYQESYMLAKPVHQARTGIGLPAHEKTRRFSESGAQARHVRGTPWARRRAADANIQVAVRAKCEALGANQERPVGEVVLRRRPGDVEEACAMAAYALIMAYNQQRYWSDSESVVSRQLD